MIIKYSIIIPTYNNASILKVNLLHISKLKKVKEDFEVIVVDNGSDDDTQKVVELFKNKIANLKYLYEASRGLHIARHAGLYAAKGEILCYIDDDSFVEKGWLKAIEKTFANKEIHLATGEIKPCFENSPAKWLKYMWEENAWGKYNYPYSLLVLRKKNMEIPHSFVFGCNFIVRKKDVIICKGFNPDKLPIAYIKYSGDGEKALACKLNNMGVKAWYNPKISIQHFVSNKKITQEYLNLYAKKEGIINSFTDLRAKFGISNFQDECVKTPHNYNICIKLRKLLDKLFENKRYKKQAMILKKNYKDTLGFYYDWHQVEFRKNENLHKWVLQSDYLHNSNIPLEYKFSFHSINVYSGEPLNGWILGKYAKILKKEYEKYGINTTLTEGNQGTATDVDFNHCIIWLHCNPETTNSNDVAMITHFGAYETFQQFEKVFSKLRLGICMSKDQMDKLIACGVNKNKLCYINPAHDDIIPVRKWVIGLASRVYSDGRKNESYFNKLANILNPRYFKFKIMGANWEEQVQYLRNKGFEIEYYQNFDYQIYTKKFFADMDYYLYMGVDEGQMGFVDAQSAGVKTIVTAQGYHLDSESTITHPFMTYDELEKIMLNIQSAKSNIVEAMHDWTWEQYALKHLILFEYLYSGKIIKNNFKDGLNSLLNNINSPVKIDKNLRKIYLNYLKRPMTYSSVGIYYTQQKRHYNILEKIFSIKNSRTKKHKVVTIFGFQLKYKRKKIN